MSTITKGFTKEQLIAKAEEQIKLTRGLNLTLSAKEHVDMCSVLFEIALASLEAEPVAWLLSGGGAKNNVSFDSGNAYADPLREVTPLYTAPPAPVSVPDAATAIRACMEEFPESVHDIVEECAAIAENACRAAMLNGDKS